MDETDGRPGHVAPQSGHLSAPTDAPVESLSHSSCAQPDQDTAALAFTDLGLRLYGNGWTNLVVRSYAARTLHAPSLNPRPLHPPAKDVCFGAHSAAMVAASLPATAALSPAPDLYKPLHIAYPAGLFPPLDGPASASFVSTQFVIEEKANENVPGK